MQPVKLSSQKPSYQPPPLTTLTQPLLPKKATASSATPDPPSAHIIDVQAAHGTGRYGHREKHGGGQESAACGNRESEAIDRRETRTLPSERGVQQLGVLKRIYIYIYITYNTYKENCLDTCFFLGGGRGTTYRCIIYNIYNKNITK